MQRTSSRIINNLAVVWQHTLSSATKLALIILCGLLLISSSFAQEPRPESPPEQSAPAAAPTQKPPDPNETLMPGPLANQTVDGDIVFTSPGQFPYPRDIRLSDNFGGLRFYGADSLTTSPAGAAIQFFGNNASPFNGQLYLDSGALNSAALIFRTAPTNGTITERMRIRSDGNVGIGTTNPVERLHVVGRGSGSSAVIVENNGGVGVNAIATGSNSAGVVGQGVVAGVEGYTSTGAGVYGFAGSSGQGVIGQSSSGRGVYGVSGTGGVGVFGESPNFQGVFGYSNTGTGIYGASDNGFAGYFGGRVNVNGILTKSSGSFRIDHPLDPANKYLSHSFVESPDMMNIYNGVAVLNRKGEAIVTMPEWFNALNKDFRYQLTCIGGFAPVYIAQKVTGNHFKIAGGKRGMEVSWQVTGVRQDAYAEAHRIKVEEEKTGKERGTYLHPEVFGQPKEKSVERVRHSEQQQQPLAHAPAQRKEN